MLQLLIEATVRGGGGVRTRKSLRDEIVGQRLVPFGELNRGGGRTNLRMWMKNANGIEKLQQLISNFVDHRSPVAGGCPILNTATEADDGNPVLRARVAKALRSWLSRLQVIVEQAQERGETRPGVDAKAVATLVVASLEGALIKAGCNGRTKRFDVSNRI